MVSTAAALLCGWHSCVTAACWCEAARLNTNRKDCASSVCRSGSVSATSKASASPEFVAPRPRATILRGPSPGKASQTLQTTTAELDKLAATLKQVQHDISLSMPQPPPPVEAGRPEPTTQDALVLNQNPRRKLRPEVDAGAAVRKPSPARKQAVQEGPAQQQRLNGDVPEVREPLAEVTNGAQVHDSVPRALGSTGASVDVVPGQGAKAEGAHARPVHASEPTACSEAAAADAEPDLPAVAAADAEPTEDADAIARAAEKARRKLVRLCWCC